MSLPGEIDGQRFLRAMGRFEWTVEKTRGSHRKLVHPAKGMIIVAFHKNLSRTSVRRALKQAGISEDEFARKL